MRNRMQHMHFKEDALQENTAIEPMNVRLVLEEVQFVWVDLRLNLYIRVCAMKEKCRVVRSLCCHRCFAAP